MSVADDPQRSAAVARDAAAGPVLDQSGLFRVLAHDPRKLLRMLSEKAAQLSAVILDGRTRQSTPDSGERAGYDRYKRKKRSQVHAAVDTLGHLPWPRLLGVPAKLSLAVIWRWL